MTDYNWSCFCALWYHIGWYERAIRANFGNEELLALCVALMTRVARLELHNAHLSLAGIFGF